MSELSPAAKAVFHAFNSKFDWVEDGVPGPQFNSIAAALRAAVDEVISPVPPLLQILMSTSEASWPLTSSTEGCSYSLLTSLKPSSPINFHPRR